MVVFGVKFHFTFDIFSHLTLFHFISWLLRTALRVDVTITVYYYKPFL